MLTLDDDVDGDVEDGVTVLDSNVTGDAGEDSVSAGKAEAKANDIQYKKGCDSRRFESLSYIRIT